MHCRFIVIHLISFFPVLYETSAVEIMNFLRFMADPVSIGAVTLVIYSLCGEVV